ncbi:uncharacterized protein LOC130654910 [Hydractinia symbiolongicarpus]|uniref:uncharacterized protein LOC130654910 n=1 Tax=Hydractinia symbiolongicarpus TaxID=13093 RepID=UPI00254B5741|nr:uncharacterized protein LOC130654910 [Hydractinia symbiolongicarpus]XP_057313546.1 uncharacterized protein LOC130654910 [Hydractinia symbiolongicarpus]
MLFLLLCSVALIKVSNASIGNQKEATETIYIKILADTSEILVAWNDTVFNNGRKFSSFESVEISYQDAEDDDAVQTKLVIPREDHGTKISVDTSKVYIFFIRYMTPSSKRCFPILVVSEIGNNKRRDIGVYDLLIKAKPNVDWGYHGDRVNQGETVYTGIASGLDDQELLSVFSYHKRYKAFLVGMKRTTAGSPVLWDMLHKECSTFQACYSNQWKKENPIKSINNFLELYGEDVPDKQHYKDGKVFGFAADNRIRYGTYSRKGGAYLYFGFGIHRSPYVGFWGDKNDDSTPFYGYFLGQRETDFIVSTSNECIFTVCGIGFQMLVHECKISHVPWNEIFCPPEMTDMTCIEKECPFDTPQNFRIEAREPTSIHLKWDAYDLSGLHAPENFIFKIKVYGINDVHLQTHDRTRDYTGIIIYNLNPFSNYTFSIEGFSTMGNVKGNSTSISSSTKEGVPNGAASFTTAESINSSCMELRWDHIPEVNVLGNLRGYELTYYITTDSLNKVDVETGLVTEYMVCGLDPFTEYGFKLRARNSDYLSDKHDYIQNRTAESVPLKFERDVWGSETGSYSLKVEWQELKNTRQWLGYPYRYHIYYRRAGVSEFTKEVVVNASTFEVEIDGLEGYREYEVAVAAATTIGVGPYSDVEVIKTGEAPPTGPPQNVTGAYNDSRSIHVNWTELIEEDRRGIITKYLVVCTTLDLVEMERRNVSSDDIRTTIFGGLEIYTPYLATVAGYTVAGLGPFSGPITIWTDAEAPFRGPYNLTGYNTSSTSIYIEWDDISEMEWAGVIGHFRLTIQSLEDPKDKNITNITRKGSENFFTYEAKDLIYFTVYQIEVVCFNTKGVSPVSNITVITEESWSVIPPPSIHAVATGFNNVSISWEYPDEKKIPGTIRGYTIRLLPIYTVEDLTIGTYSTRQRRSTSNELCADGQYCAGLQLQMDNITVSGSGTVSFNTSGLRGYTHYNISISVDTKFVGLASSPIQIFTPEGTPSMSAFNFTCEGVSYSSLLLQWKHSPPAYLEGIRTKYMIYYQFENKIVNETHEPYKRRMELFFLKANTEYTVWMTAFTSAGEGASTEKLNCSTFETEPTAAPTNVTATSFHYPYASLIQWEHIPDDQWQGSKQGYTVFYEKLSTGEVDVGDGWIKTTRVDVPLTTSYFLEGLELYSVYRVRVAARSKSGVGFKSDPVQLETCHVPQAKLILNYMIYPPYVDYPKGNSLRPEGILMDLTEQMLLTCAHTCISFNESVYISYNRVDLDSFSDIKNFTINGTGLQVPRMDTGKFTPDYSLVTTTTSPGFILLETPDSPVQAATKVEDGLLDGVFSTLPICALYFVINWLFGAMFWFCEPTKVEHRGRGMSLAGIFEGLYLAIMTSTTVGYGDKIPETTSGRIYIVFWTLLGLVLTGIVTGSLSSALSVASINSMKQQLPDDKVLALYGSAEYTYGKKKMKKFDTNVTYYSYEELFEPLRNKSVKFALLDRYVAEILKTNLSEYGLIVNKAFDVPTDFGVAAFGEMEKLKVCGVKFAKENTDITSKAISKLLEELAKAKSGKNSSSSSSSSSTSATTEGSVDLISFQAPLYQKTFKIVLIIWAVFIMIGLIYEIFRRRRVNFIKNKIHTERELNLLRLADLQSLVRESRKEFQEMITSVEDKIEKLNYKHGKQLLKMRTEISKRYGVNFKYIKPSELGVPLEKILEYKEDLKNKPKDPFSVKFRKFRVSVASAFVTIIRFFRGKNFS